jgi:hypothetical protein
MAVPIAAPEAIAPSRFKSNPLWRLQYRWPFGISCLHFTPRAVVASHVFMALLLPIGNLHDLGNIYG